MYVYIYIYIYIYGDLIIISPITISNKTLSFKRTHLI